MRSLLVASSLVLSQGCIEYQPVGDDTVLGVPNPRALETPRTIDKIVQVQVPEVDVLFVMDNSCSMSEEQSAVADNFPVFMDFFLGSGLDYHIGVVATDMIANDFSGKLRNVRGYRFIDESTEDPVTIFGEMVQLGTFGSGSERGRDAAYVALERRKDGYNAGFVREQASLHIVAISDENDQSNEVSIAEFVQWIRGLKWAEDMISFSSIVSEAPTCPGAQSPGTNYTAVTDAVGGIFWSICTEDWGEALELLGIQASGLKREYFLSQLPVDGTITVSVVEDGVAFLFASGIDWSYNASRNSVIFTEYIPSPMAEVYVEYDVLAALDDQL